MICGLACPYGISSPGGINGKPYCELIELGAFRQSLASGKCLATGRTIYACLNHLRDRKHRLGSVADGRLRLFETAEGVIFELDAELPKRVTGASISFKARRWRQEGLLYRLQEACLTHIAILTWPYSPAHPATANTIREVKKECRPRM